jgi:hypothetical protein
VTFIGKWRDFFGDIGRDVRAFGVSGPGRIAASVQCSDRRRRGGEAWSVLARLRVEGRGDAVDAMAGGCGIRLGHRRCGRRRRRLVGKPGDPTAGRPAYARSGIRMPLRTLGALRWR